MVFLSIFGVGLLLTLVTFIIGEIFDLGDLGDGADHLGAGPSPLSSRILFVFVTAFGGFGFIGQTADWPLWLSASAALVGAVAVAGGTFFLVVLPMARQQGSVRLSTQDLVNLEGEVTDDIPPGGFGRVALVPPGTGARITRSARSQHGDRLPPGTAVRVVHAGPGSLTVTPIQRDSDGTDRA